MEVGAENWPAENVLQSGTHGKFLVFWFEIFPEKDSMRQFILTEFKGVCSHITNVANLFCVSSRNSIFLILRMEEIEGGSSNFA